MKLLTYSAGIISGQQQVKPSQALSDAKSWANPKAGFLSAYFLCGLILFKSCQCWCRLAQRKCKHWGNFYNCYGIMLGTVQTRQQRNVQLSQLHSPLDVDQPSPRNLISSCEFYLFITLCCRPCRTSAVWKRLCDSRQKLVLTLEVFVTAWRQSILWLFWKF